jgi:hypothetical protein
MGWLSKRAIGSSEMPMSKAQIDFSAQFGGRDAAAAVLPHFKALKSAARGVELKDFAFLKLAFILRVDGEVNQYGLSGVGGIEINRKENYLSVDIGISTNDRAHIEAKLCGAILESVEPISEAVGIGQLERDDLSNTLALVVNNYRSSLSK